MSAAPSPATWRPYGSSDDVPGQRDQMERRRRREHEPVAGAVQQPRALRDFRGECGGKFVGEQALTTDRSAPPAPSRAANCPEAG